VELFSKEKVKEKKIRQDNISKRKMKQVTISKKKQVISNLYSTTIYNVSRGH